MSKNEKQKTSYELQKIDCNCNDCAFLIRDFDKLNGWKAKHQSWQRETFDKKKVKAISDAKRIGDAKSRETALRKANKLQFQFDATNTISYGHCDRFDKQISFIPNICQIETQECFEHRSDSDSTMMSENAKLHLEIKQLEKLRK